MTVPDYALVAEVILFSEGKLLVVAREHEEEMTDVALIGHMPECKRAKSVCRL